MTYSIIPSLKIIQTPSHFSPVYAPNWFAFSLSASNTNLLMWSHYADSHKGYCVGFDSDRLSIIAGTPLKVNYDNSLPEIGLFDESIESFMKLFITKSCDWFYENEFRLLTVVNQCKRTYKFDNDCLKEIILGCRIEPRVKRNILKIKKKKFPLAAVFESSLHPTRFEIELNRIE